MKASLFNTGLVEIGTDAALTGTSMTITSVLGQNGLVSLQEASMTVYNKLSIHEGGHIQDNGLLSQIILHGDVENRPNATTQFRLDHSNMSLYKPLQIIGPPVTPPAQSPPAFFNGEKNSNYFG